MIAFRTAAKIGLHGLVEAPWRMLATLALSACALGALGMSVSAAAFDVLSAKEQVLFEDGYVVQSMDLTTEADAEEAERAAGVSLARLSSTGGFRDFTLFLGAEPQGKLELSSCLTASPEWLMYADGEYLSAVGAEVIGRLPEREGEVALSLCLVNSFLEFGYYDNIASPTQFDEDYEMIRDESFLYEFDSAEELVAAGCRLTMKVGYEEDAPESTLTIVGAVDEHCPHDHRAADFVQRAEPFDKVYLSREQFTSCAEVFAGGAWNYLLAPRGERAEDRGGLVAYVEEQEALSFSSTLLSSLEEYASALEGSRDIFFYVGLGLIVFAAALIYQFVSFSMEKKKRQIGVLRALGATGRDIAVIFLMESLFLAVLQAALGAGLSFAFAAATNATLAAGIELPVAFASIRGWSIPALFGLSIAVSLLSAAVPIVRTVKKSPVEAIRDNEE